MARASEQECEELVRKLRLRIDLIYEDDDDGWTIAIVYGGSVELKDRMSFCDSLPPCWFTRWMDSEQRGIRCLISKK